MINPTAPTTQRSKWLEEDVPETLAAVMAGRNAKAVSLFRRPLHDGTISAVKWIDEEGNARLSVTHAMASAKRLPRYPSLGELADARYSLLPPEMGLMMYMPTADEYADDTQTTLYLSEFEKPS